MSVPSQALRAPLDRGRILTVLGWLDRKITRLNSSHSQISYAVFCLTTHNLIPHGHAIMWPAGHNTVRPAAASTRRRLPTVPSSDPPVIIYCESSGALLRRRSALLRL